MAAFNSLIRRASFLLKLGSDDSNQKVPPLDGEIIFCKNNVCVHPPFPVRQKVHHHPGYFTIKSQDDKTLGRTLILTWIPNVTLKRNPHSLESPVGSPCQSSHSSSCPSPVFGSHRSSLSRVASPYPASIGAPPPGKNDSETGGSESQNSDSCASKNSKDYKILSKNLSNQKYKTEPPQNGKLIKELPKKNDYVDIGISPKQITEALESMISGLNDIDNSDYFKKADTKDNKSACDEKKANSLTLDLKSCEKSNGTPNINVSAPTSDCSSSTTPTTSNKDPDSLPESPELSPSHKQNFHFSDGTPESRTNHLSLPDTPGSANSNRIPREGSYGVFSVNLSQMRSLRLFFSSGESSSGQLVIASSESQYKIFHFHHGGLDKLATCFQEYNFLSKETKSGKQPYHQFLVCQREVQSSQSHPLENIYSILDESIWQQFINEDGVIDDDIRLREVIFFAGLDPRLRREIWPFLLHYYDFRSTFYEREQIRNDKYIEYQSIRSKRQKMSKEEKEIFWKTTECTVEKDVVRTDRSKPFFAGDDNPNIITMKNLLLNYAVYNPNMGYTQGMSDLLSPLLMVLRDEPETFWCFVGLMQRTIFVSSPKDTDMNTNLTYLSELIRLMLPCFYNHLKSNSDASELLFAHRWILLCFKREFPESDALKIWEACWSHYQTDYFHLFVCLAIVSIYGDDVLSQRLRADETLLHFSSLAMHMDGELVLKKARGLLHQFRSLPQIPCTLTRLCELCGPGMWDSGHVPAVECVGNHSGDCCPHGGVEGPVKHV